MGATCIFPVSFDTLHRNVNVNDTSSYVDLSPLYGHGQDEQDRVRRKEGM
jgi:hypothetical protein